jgi:hypothetical protein
VQDREIARSWLFQGQKIFNANVANKANSANFLLSFAKIRPVCAFRVKPCYKIKKMSSDTLEKP